MDAKIKERLETAGFRETTVEELFGLTPEESELVETRLALARLIKRLRLRKHLTQAMVAKQIKSHQGNVSKAEKNDPSISIEWMFKAAFALGASREEVGRALFG